MDEPTVSVVSTADVKLRVERLKYWFGVLALEVQACRPEVAGVVNALVVEFHAELDRVVERLA